MHSQIGFACLVPLIVLSCANGAETERGPSRLPIIGIDHIPTAVRNLEEATNAYRQLGFAVKPGRSHENGIRNNHVKFEDGSGIELISPPDIPVDELTGQYAEHVEHGEGPAYIMFHARDMETLRSTLALSGFRYRNDAGGLVLEDSSLHYLFFGRDNRSPTDRPEHFAHPNSAIAMSGIWLALDDIRRESLTRLLLALGAVRSKGRVLVPDPGDAEVFRVQNGRVVVVPDTHEIFDGRPIVGAEFQVLDLAKTPCYPGTVSVFGRPDSPSRCVVPPSEAFGLWLTFHE